MSNEILFRYFDADQFYDTITNSSLFFIHRDQVSQYEEGKLPGNIETQIRLWASRNHSSILQQQFQQFHPVCILSSYNEEEILKAELEKTKKFLDLCFFSCWHMNRNFSKDVMQGLGKSIAIKTSKNKLLDVFNKKGIFIKSGEICYYDDLNSVNAIRRVDLLFSIPKIWENENEFRILLPLFKSAEIFKYEAFPENCTIQEKKEYEMYKYLLNSVVENEYEHGVNVPIDLKIISEIYLPKNLMPRFENLLKSKKLIKKVRFYK